MRSHSLLYLCHVRKSEVASRVFLVFLHNSKKLFLPLHSHIKLGVVACIVVEGEGHDESLSVSVVIIWEKQYI